MTGRSSPAIAAIRPPHRPAQTTTASARIVPRGVATPLMRPSSMTSDVAGVLAKALSLPAASRPIDEFAGDRLRARHDEPGVGVPQAALDLVLLDQRKPFA